MSIVGQLATIGAWDIDCPHCKRHIALAAMVTGERADLWLDDVIKALELKRRVRDAYQIADVQ